MTAEARRGAGKRARSSEIMTLERVWMLEQQRPRRGSSGRAAVSSWREGLLMGSAASSGGGGAAPPGRGRLLQILATRTTSPRRGPTGAGAEPHPRAGEAGGLAAAPGVQETGTAGVSGPGWGRLHFSPRAFRALLRLLRPSVPPPGRAAVPSAQKLSGWHMCVREGGIHRPVLSSCPTGSSCTRPFLAKCRGWPHVSLVPQGIGRGGPGPSVVLHALARASTPGGAKVRGPAQRRTWLQTLAETSPGSGLAFP